MNAGTEGERLTASTEAGLRAGAVSLDGADVTSPAVRELKAPPSTTVPEGTMKEVAAAFPAMMAAWGEAFWRSVPDGTLADVPPNALAAEELGEYVRAGVLREVTGRETAGRFREYCRGWLVPSGDRWRLIVHPIAINDAVVPPYFTMPSPRDVAHALNGAASVLTVAVVVGNPCRPCWRGATGSPVATPATPVVGPTTPAVLPVTQSGAGEVAAAHVVDAEDVAGALAAPPHIDHRPDHRAHHLVAERGGLDLEAQSAVAVVVPGGLGDAAHEARLQPVTALRPTAEGGEVVLTDDRVARQDHRRQLQGHVDVPGRGGDGRVRRRAVVHQVAVQTGRGGEPGVESDGGPDSPVLDGSPEGDG